MAANSVAEELAKQDGKIKKKLGITSPILIDGDTSVAKAYGASKLLKPFFTSKSLPQKWRLRVYSQVLQSIIAYSTESTVLSNVIATCSKHVFMTVA